MACCGASLEVRRRGFLEVRGVEEGVAECGAVGYGVKHDADYDKHDAGEVGCRANVEYGIEFEAIEGLFGFEDVRYYTFAELAGGGPFRWLQATRGVKLAFVVAPPGIFWPSYSITVAAVGSHIAAGVSDAAAGLAVDDPVDANPRAVGPATIGADVLSSLGATSVSDLTPLIIVTVPDDPLLATGNFAAPVLVNPKTRKLRQVILHDSGYPISHPLFPDSIRLFPGSVSRPGGTIGGGPGC
ncbi:MAG TPA: flagellar assembly protein FliW [Firmicutes bacterium]|nr:flagellar assembly protein FliW [Bacillota bacterium]